MTEQPHLEKSSKKYSVVLVEYFSGDFLISCLESLYSQTLVPEKIVVVINGIEDDYRKKLENNFPDVHVIDPHANFGYSRAANLGIANTTSDIILTLNPDTELENDAAEIACTFMATHFDVGTVGPRIYELNGEIYPSAREEPSIIDAIGHAILGSFRPDNRFTRRYKNIGVDNDAVRDAGWLSGAAVFIRREALDDIGGWDEDFFMYCEDIDLGRKMRLNRWRNVYVPESRVTHVQGVSTSRTPIPLLIEHHKSLYIYTKKKYPRNLGMRILVGIFIAVRLPVALIAHIFRIS